MKLHILCILFIAFCAHNTNASLAKTQPQAPAKADEDRDTQVVAQSMGTIIQALGTFSQNPNNPVIAGACALQALGAFIKMLIQIFDEAAPTTRRLHSQQEIEQWFIHLPKEKQIQIMQLMIAYGSAYNKKFI